MNQSISSLPAVVRRHRWPALATFVSVICGSLAYLIVAPPLFEAKVRIILNDKQWSVSEFGRVDTQSPALDASPIANQVELARSQRVLKQAFAQASLQGINNLPKIEEFKNDLTVSIIPGTGILEMSYQSQNPSLTSELLNSVAAAMVKENAEAFRLQARSVREFLQTELPKKQVQLIQAEAAESQYKKSSGIVSLTDQTDSLVKNLASLEEQERALSAQLQEANARGNSLEGITNSGSPKNTYLGARIAQDEELKLLRAQLTDLESQVIVNRARLNDTHPKMVTLFEQVNATRALYNQKLSSLLPKDALANFSNNVASDELSQNLASQIILSENDRSALERKLAVVSAQRVNFQTRLDQLPARQQGLAALTRQREQAAASFESLQRKLEEARIAEAQSVSNINIIDSAELPKKHNWPNTPVVLVIAIATGIILAIGVVLLLEVLNGKLYTAAEAEELVKLPVMGVLPVLHTASLNLEKPELFLEDSGAVEAYRTLLKTMEFRSGRDLRVVVVGSSLSGEGKSVVVSHLAIVSAMLSRRTLIIDADLRCPKQHTLFNLAIQPGFKDVNNGSVSLAEAVQQTNIKHLSVLTCGQPSENPSQFLESAQMHTLLKEAAAHYDLVIIDTPPVTSCIDATILSRDSDGLLLIARPNFTRREVLLRTVSELTSNQVNIIGVAVNGFTPETEKYYGYPIQGYQSPGAINQIIRQ